MGSSRTEKKKRQDARKRLDRPPQTIFDWFQLSEAMAVQLNAGVSVRRAAFLLGISPGHGNNIAKGWRASTCPLCRSVVFGRPRPARKLQEGTTWIGVVCGHWVQPSDGKAGGQDARDAVARNDARQWAEKQLEPPAYVPVEDGEDRPEYRHLNKPASIALVAKVAKNRWRVGTFRWQTIRTERSVAHPSEPA